MALTDNLIAAYKLDDVTDGTTNGYNLTNNNSVSFATAGIIGNCADFGSTNTNKLLSRATDFSNGGGDFTISCWIKVYSTSTGQCAFELQSSAQPWFRAFFMYDGANTRLFSGWHGGGSIGPSVTLNTSTWYNIILTNSSGTLELFYNNTSQGTTATHYGGDLTPTNTFQLGGSIALQGAGVGVPGLIDSCYVWTRVITSGERATMYNSGNGYEISFGGGTTRIANNFTLLGVG